MSFVQSEPDRTVQIISDTIGDTVTPTVTALLATAAAVTRNPEIAVLSIPTGAFAGALSKQGAMLVFQTLRDRADRVREFADRVAEEAGQNTEEFIDEHVDSGAKRTLLGHAVDAATDATTAWKIKTLARAFVRGVSGDDKVDETLMFVELLRGLEPGHARFLAAAQRCPEGTWLTFHVVSQDPGLESSAGFIRKQLTDMGLVEKIGTGGDGDQVEFTLTDVGYSCAKWLRTLARDTATE
jgi:hypothetical protein